jgi:hypothetical protein
MDSVVVAAVEEFQLLARDHLVVATVAQELAVLELQTLAVAAVDVTQV